MFILQPTWWIPAIDWRISGGIIFAIQLLLWGHKEKRRTAFGVRIAFCISTLTVVSWALRYLLEELVTSRMTNAWGYAVYILALCAIFTRSFHFCYEVPMDTVVFIGMVAVTVYRTCWNAVKLVSCMPISPTATWTGGSPLQSIGSYLLYLLVIILCYEVYQYTIKKQVILPGIRYIFLVIVFLQMLLEYVFQYFYLEDGYLSILYFLTALLYCIMSYGLMVGLGYLSILQEENTSMQNFIHSKHQYYEISRDGILSLQIKCHDLKHQIAKIRTAEGKQEMEKHITRLVNSIDEYNTVIDSGNKDVDVVLTEKNIVCSVNDVRFTYIIDGTLFSFLSDMEIYALFGNALDNAMEGMARVKRKDLRFISLKAGRRGDLVILVVENYMEGALTFSDDLPITTKPDEAHHGFGLRSIRGIAEQHGGGISVEAKEPIFRLVVTMEAPKG